ncbi:fungal-specific transcription factor domain-containing protein [Rhypophila decipiens]|uniref:Fungal-specific transcription factor domain-containing protein n=1 Tax=Rhypophila decipiens TaxID=261697 RepID=A0AAN7B2S9_9PEZI|nr:fungal-specific transcription factor domain-containing protein [Rhypophila decipiens]
MPGDGSPNTGRAVSDGSPVVDHPTQLTHPAEGYDAQQIQALARHPPPGASVYSPTAMVSSALNPRSCVTCRRRKVRCDKHMPCSNCRRAQIPCIFPAPGRAPRRPRPKDPNAPSKQPSSERELELVKRLRKLEGIVEELSGQIEIETVRHTSSAGNSPEAVGSHEGEQSLSRAKQGVGDGISSRGGSARSQGSPLTGNTTGRANPQGQGGSPGYNSSSHSSPAPVNRSPPDVHKKFGRLVLNEKGVTRYVSSALWSRINDELDEIREETHTLTDDESEESDVENSPAAVEEDRTNIGHQSFIFGYSSSNVDLRPLHPLPSQIPFIWTVYQENVDAILKVLHVPTMNKLIRDLRNNMDTLTPATEALMFSIYYAAITSLDEDEVKLNFGSEKEVLVKQYRFALEQALAKANFINAPDITVAQAFLLFLILVRRHDDTRFAWTLTGLLIRISQALGLHRDGTNFPNLTPFEVEMRRRLFWAVCFLDLRSAEDQGTDLTIVDRAFDTQMPLNINDSDISPDSKELPKPREGPTDMTFSLIRYEVSAVARRLHTVASASAPVCPRDASTSLEEREALLSNVHKRVVEKYLNHRECDNNPMYWVAGNVARIIIAKMTLVIYQPLLFPAPGQELLSDDIRARLFNAAIEMFEYNYLLNTDPRCKQWRWLFQTYTVWHAVAFVLIEVTHRPWGVTAERAWAALNSLYSAPAPSPLDLEKMISHKAIWLPFKKLYFKAKKHRDVEIGRLQADPQAALELDLEYRSRAAPESFGALSGSVKGMAAHERWRKLVNAPPVPQNPPPTFQSGVTQVGSDAAQAAGLDLGNVDNPVFMDYISDAMANPAFSPADLTALWPRPKDDGAAATFGFSAGDIGTEMTLGYQVNHHDSNQNNRQQQHSLSGGLDGGRADMTSPLINYDNPPPWIWPTASDGSSGEMLRVPNWTPEDGDVNMEEGFDWQNWQESLGRFEMEANGGFGNGTWATGL